MRFVRLEPPTIRTPWLRCRPPCNQDDAINIQFTSGTTGNPKGATLSHCNILNNGFLTGLAMQLGPEDKLYSSAPVSLFRDGSLSAGMRFSMAPPWYFPGPRLILRRRLNLLRRRDVLRFTVCPLCLLPNSIIHVFQSFDLSTLRTGIMAGAPCL